MFNYARDQYIDPGLPRTAQNNLVLQGFLALFIVLGGGLLITGIAHLRHYFTHQKSNVSKETAGVKKHTLKKIASPNITGMILAGKIPNTNTPTANAIVPIVTSTPVSKSPKKIARTKSYFDETNKERKTQEAMNAISGRQAIRRASKPQDETPKVKKNENNSNNNQIVNSTTADNNNNNNDTDNFAERMYARLNGQQLSFSFFSFEIPLNNTLMNYMPFTNRPSN